MILRFKSKKYNFLWPLYILKYCLPIIFITFFGQTFILILSVYECTNGITFYDENYSCPNKKAFRILYPLTVFPIIIQIFFGFITVTLYFIPDYISINNNNSVLVKRNTLSDISFLFCKIIIIAFFIFDKEIENEHLEIIIFICLLTGFNAYCNLFWQNYSNIIIKRFNNLLCLILFWSFFNLLIKKIFASIGYNGEIYLFICGLFLIILYYSYYSRKSTDFLKLQFNNITSNTECLNYIKYFLKILHEKDISRDSSLIFNSYIEKIEKNCVDKKCPLKKYLESLSQGITSKYLLLQYVENLYKKAKSKFPNDTILRINYAIFLCTQCNKKKEAQNELESINSYFYNDNFNLFVCKKYLEEFQLINFENNKNELEIMNMNQNLEYKNNSKNFKELIIKSASLYYDFWISLHNYHIQGIEDFNKLNDIGNKINKIIKDIDNIFEKLNKFKINYEIIKLYESFSKDILNNNEKYQKSHNILINLLSEKKISNEREINFLNFDMKFLIENDDNNYLIISVEEKGKGVIKNISFGICQMFGYHKDEIIGKNINIFIPEIFQKDHDKLINDLFEKSKTKFYDCLINKLIYKPEYIKLYTHAKNKSKYLIPLHLLIYLVKTEEAELVYIVEVKRNNSYIGVLNSNFNVKEEKNINICCILTDINFKIQTFTSNCLELLKLNTNFINSNIDITSFIKQLNNDLLTNPTLTKSENLDFDDSEIRTYDKMDKYGSNKSSNRFNLIDKTNLNKTKNITKLIKSKYSYPNEISWIIDTNGKSSITYKKEQIIKKSTLFSTDIKNNSINNTIYEKKFLMQVREAYINNRLKGYYFYFDELKSLYKKKTNNIKNVKSFFRPKSKVNYFNYKKIKIDDEQNINAKISRKNTLHLRGENKSQGKNVNFDFYRINIKRSKSRNEYYQDDIITNEYNINPNYIPKSKFNFVLDLNTISYKPCTNITSFLDIVQNLKKQAYEKITIQQKSNKANTN